MENKFGEYFGAKLGKKRNFVFFLPLFSEKREKEREASKTIQDSGLNSRWVVFSWFGEDG